MGAVKGMGGLLYICLVVIFPPHPHYEMAVEYQIWLSSVETCFEMGKRLVPDCDRPPGYFLMERRRRGFVMEWDCAFPHQITRTTWLGPVSEEELEFDLECREKRCLEWKVTQ